MQNSGFIDLRVGHGSAGLGDDSVWPSFTDIMTVIVMIFLLALVMMMARNLELDRQLVTSISERDANLLENRGLLEKLNALERRTLALQQSLGVRINERDALRAQLLAELKRIELMTADHVGLEQQLAQIIAERKKLTAEKRQLTAQARVRGENLAAAQTQVAALTANEAKLSQKIAALATQLDALQPPAQTNNRGDSGQTLSERLDRLAARLRLLQQQLAQRESAATAKIENLTERIRQRRAENAALQKLADASSVKFQTLQEEYDSLDAQYRTLVRPARNAAGKHVVEVSLVKTAPGYQFGLKEPSQREPRAYSRAKLEQRLASLKSEHGKNLYTKVVIPEHSGLSHNEAWQFTQQILRGYDYYYQPE